MTRDLKTPLAPTFPQDTEAVDRKKPKQSRACKKHKRGCKKFRKNVKKHGYGGF